MQELNVSEQELIEQFDAVRQQMEDTRPAVKKVLANLVDFVQFHLRLIDEAAGDPIRVQSYTRTMSSFLDRVEKLVRLGHDQGLALTKGVSVEDLAQLTARYGPKAGTVVNNHRAKLYLAGIADPATLEHASTLIGEAEHQTASTTVDGRRATSTTRAGTYRRLAPAASADDPRHRRVDCGRRHYLARSTPRRNYPCYLVNPEFEQDRGRCGQDQRIPAREKADFASARCPGPSPRICPQLESPVLTD